MALQVSHCTEPNEVGLAAAFWMIAGVFLIMTSLMLAVIIRYQYQPFIHEHREDQGEDSKVLNSLTHVTRFFEGKVLPHTLHVAGLGMFRDNLKPF